MTVPEGSPLMALGVERQSSIAVLSSVLIVSAIASICANAPATCGAAMLVPDCKPLASSLPLSVDRIDVPGARMSTHGPWLLKLLSAS